MNIFGTSFNYGSVWAISISKRGEKCIQEQGIMAVCTGEW